VSCKKSGFGDMHLGTQSFFCQVLTQAWIPHDRKVDIAGNGRHSADILLKAWDGRRDLAVDLTIAHPRKSGKSQGKFSRVLWSKGFWPC